MSSAENPFDSPIVAVQPPERRRRKWWLIGCSSLGCLVTVILCSGLISLLMVTGRRHVVWSSKDPAAIRAQLDTIVKLEIPLGLQPKFVVQHSTEGKPDETVIVYLNAAGGSLLIGRVEGTSPRQMESRVGELLRSAPPGSGPLRDTTTREVERQIHEATANFQITEGLDASERRIRRVSGNFLGKTGNATLLLQSPVESLSDADSEAFLNSLH